MLEVMIYKTGTCLSIKNARLLILRCWECDSDVMWCDVMLFLVTDIPEPALSPADSECGSRHTASVSDTPPVRSQHLCQWKGEWESVTIRTYYSRLTFSQSSLLPCAELWQMPVVASPGCSHWWPGMEAAGPAVTAVITWQDSSQH